MKANNKPIKVVVTGGHHTPALAVIEELKRSGNFEFYWIGHSISLRGRGERAFSVEVRTIQKLRIPFYNLWAGKLYKTNLTEWLKVPLGFLHALYLLVKIRPSIVISFGGYLAVPVVLAAFFLRIPSVTHEQTVVSGWANRFIAFFVKKIFVSWKTSLDYFPKEKTMFVGNPIRKDIFTAKTNRFIFKNNLPTIYITGGKQGSHVINEAVRKSLSRFLEHYNVIHQTGSSEIFKDYQKIMLLKNQLSENLKTRFIAQEYFGEDEIGAVLSSAQIVVSRAGANTVYELAALGKPSVLIPIPWVSHGEQFKNAKVLADLGACLILLEKDLSSSSLLEAIDFVVANFDRYQKSAKQARKIVNLDAASRIASEIVLLLK